MDKLTNPITLLESQDGKCLSCGAWSQPTRTFGKFIRRKLCSQLCFDEVIGRSGDSVKSWVAHYEETQDFTSAEDHAGISALEHPELLTIAAWITAEREPIGCAIDAALLDIEKIKATCMAVDEYGDMRNPDTAIRAIATQHKLIMSKMSSGESDAESSFTKKLEEALARRRAIRLEQQLQQLE